MRNLEVFGIGVFGYLGRIFDIQMLNVGLFVFDAV